MSPTSSTRHRLAAATVATAVALVAGCANDRQVAAPPRLKVDLVAALQPFDRCDDFLSYVKREAGDRVTAYGLDGGNGMVMKSDSMPVPMASAGRADDGFTSVAGEAGAPATTAAAPEAAAPRSDAAAKSSDVVDDSGSTGTNNQEAGVDEADLVKIDGNRIVTVRGNELIVVTLTDGAPSVTARLALGDEFGGERLFLLADRAYVLGTDNTPIAMRSGIEGDVMYPGAYQPRSEIVEVSLTGAPAVTHSVTIDGSILDGRLANGAVRLVTTSPGGAGLGFVYPSGNGDQKAIDRAEATNRSVIDESTLDDWMPTVSVDGAKPAPLLDCDHLYRPAEPSGFSMLSILTISDGLGSLTGSGILADGQITYASTDHLYVATNQYDMGDVPEGATAKRAASTAEHTDVHSFSIDGTAPATYEASGRVDGHVLNQYSMSESGDDLRIATTVSSNNTVTPTPACPPNADCAISEIAPDVTVGDNRIVVLRRSGEELQEIGRIAGLGAGEQIKSVRYVGDVAYVVTFRQTDPFYVIDLADPTSPKKLGELKVPGFSSYLHPVGDHLVLGIGSAAEETGGVTGAKVSLYDTSDPVTPKELDTLEFDGMDFTAAYDPHAIAWDADRSTAYLPYTAYQLDAWGMPTSGVLVVRVADGKVTEVGRIDHSDRTPAPAPSPTTTVPETTTTVPETTVPETTVPGTTTTTTIEDTVTTTAPAVPPTTVAGDGSVSSSIAVGEAPIPVDPGIGCDPAACDGPSPYPYGYLPTITRVFVVGDRVVTLSDAGIAAHTVDGLRPTGFAAF